MSISDKNDPEQQEGAKSSEVSRIADGEMFTSGTWITRAPRQTVDLGRTLGKCLTGGDVVALYGELGSGKTTFVKGMVSGLDAERAESVRSPTFVFLNMYKGRLPVYHIDLYRVQSAERLDDMGFREYAFGKGVTIIEWAEKAEHLLPQDAVRVWLKSIGRRSREVRVKLPERKPGTRS